MKFVKVFSLESFLLYGISITDKQECIKINALLYTWKVSLGENFATWQKVCYANLLSCVNDCIEDMATMTALAKNYPCMHQNTKVAGLGKIKNFHVNSILSTQCLRKSYA